MLDINQPHLNPTKNLAVTVVYCGHGHDVTDSIIDGRLVMRDRKLLTLDEKKIIADASQHMRACISRAGILFGDSVLQTLEIIQSKER